MRASDLGPSEDQATSGGLPACSILNNRPFPSCLLPLFQNESKCETFHMKMSFTHKSIRMQIILIFI